MIVQEIEWHCKCTMETVQGRKGFTMFSASYGWDEECVLWKSLMVWLLWEVRGQWCLGWLRCRYVFVWQGNGQGRNKCKWLHQRVFLRKWRGQWDCLWCRKQEVGRHCRRILFHWNMVRCEMWLASYRWYILKVRYEKNKYGKGKWCGTIVICVRRNFFVLFKESR